MAYTVNTNIQKNSIQKNSTKKQYLQRNSKNNPCFIIHILIAI